MSAPIVALGNLTSKAHPCQPGYLILNDWEQPRSTGEDAASAHRRNLVVEPHFDHEIQREPARTEKNGGRCGVRGFNPDHVICGWDIEDSERFVLKLTRKVVLDSL